MNTLLEQPPKAGIGTIEDGGISSQPSKVSNKRHVKTIALAAKILVYAALLGILALLGLSLVAC